MKTESIQTVGLYFILAFPFLFGCSERSNHETEAIESFNAYYSEVKDRSDDKWNYTADTVKVWFDNREGEPIYRIKGKRSTGPWADWDVEMNASSSYDTIWYLPEEHAVQGYFYENNEFYDMIGKSPTKTKRTYWLNSENKVSEILLYWIPEENTTTAEHLGPIVEWAIENDSLEISQLYPDGNIVPSRENAVRWKKLLRRYNESIDE